MPTTYWLLTGLHSARTRFRIRGSESGTRKPPSKTQQRSCSRCSTKAEGVLVGLSVCSWEVVVALRLSATTTDSKSWRRNRRLPNGSSRATIIAISRIISLFRTLPIVATFAIFAERLPIRNSMANIPLWCFRLMWVNYCFRAGWKLRSHRTVAKLRIGASISISQMDSLSGTGQRFHILSGGSNPYQANYCN